jgi:hypothetical protein
MTQLIKHIERNVSGIKVLVLFILTNVVYVLMLTVTIPETMKNSAGLNLLDMMPTGYNLSYVIKLFDSLGEIGRRYYLTIQIPLDMLYPLLFGLTYCLLLAYFLKQLKKLYTPYIYLCLLPVVVGIADYLENTGIISLLIHYPDITERMVSVTSLFSVIKSTSTSLFFVVLIIVIVLYGIKAIGGKKPLNASLKK